MKKFVTLMLVALIAVSAMFLLVACNDKPLENEGYYYILAGGKPGWGLDSGVAPTDTAVAPRLMTAISLKDERLKPIKDQLKGVKYLYALDYDYGTENAGWGDPITLPAGDAYKDVVYAAEGKPDGNQYVKIIRYELKEAGDLKEWVPVWHSSPECGGQVKSLTPDTLWEPQFAESPEDGTSGWNANGVLLKGLGKYTIVFAAFEDGTFGVGAIKVA